MEFDDMDDTDEMIQVPKSDYLYSGRKSLIATIYNKKEL